MNVKIRQLLLPAVVPILLIMGAAFAQAPRPKSVPANSSAVSSRTHSFEGGEELVYVAEFSRLLIKKMDVADFRFSASRQEPLKAVDSGLSSNIREPYSLKLTADISSKGFFSKLFNLTFRERVESIVEPTSFTVQKTKRTDEQGKRVRISETTYDRGKLFWIERDPNNPARVPRTATVSFTGQVQDLLSAVYYLRIQPLEVGKSFEITLSDSGRVFQVPVRVVEKKRMKTVLGKVEAVRVDPQLHGPNGMVGGKGQFSIWLTNDNRRIPVKARIKLDYGTVDINLRKVVTPSARGALAKTTL
ncbi:MAG: DUF3108 domain-containing protein [Pyrinomonadaceae bacterium]|nr:DUF3108 domain-containing protein [Pyrinomonadaceae bacterium]